MEKYEKLIKIWEKRVEYCMDKFRQGNLTDSEILDNAKDLVEADESLFHWSLTLLEETKKL